MTALAEKLKDAGADTIGARLTSACTDAMRRHPQNLSQAWADVGASFGLEFLRGLQVDMRAHEPPPEPRYKASFGGRSSGMSLFAPASSTALSITPKYQPRVMPQERIERRQKLQEVVRSKFKNSAGVSWSDVGWHELPAMKRDGAEAMALLAAGPANVPNDGRSVGEVHGTKLIDEIIGNVRAEA